MLTFVPYGAEYYRAGLELDLKRLGKQLVEVQQMHAALVGNGPAHILHHPATQAWAGHEGALLDYGCAVYAAWRKRTGKKHGSGDYCLTNGGKVCAAPDWLTAMSPYHRGKLYAKAPELYPQFADHAYLGNQAIYPVTVDGKTVGWVQRQNGAKVWELTVNGDAAVRTFPTAWAAICSVR